MGDFILGSVGVDIDIATSQEVEEYFDLAEQDEHLKRSDVTNNLTTTTAGKVLDARQGKVLKDGLDQTDNDIAIIIDGNKTTHTGGAAIGEFVLVRNSTITGITDGLYKATQAIPANTAIDSTYLTAVDGGGLNDLGKRIKSAGVISSQIDTASYSCQSGTFLTIAEFHPTITGNYIIIADATYGGDADGIRILLVDVVETDQNTGANSVLASGRAALQKTRIFNLTTNDTVYIRVYQTSGVTLPVTGSYRFVLLRT